MPSTQAEINYRALFESVPGLYLILSPDLTIISVSEAYLGATLTKRDEIIGKYLFDVFPDNPNDSKADGSLSLKASLESVLKTKEPHWMPMLKYDIRNNDGTFEERYWRVLNKPVLNENNEVVFIINCPKDVTEFVVLKKDHQEKDRIAADLRTRSQEMEIEIIRRAQEVEKLNKELEKKVASRTVELEVLNKDVADYKFALDESSIVAVTDQKGIIHHVNDNFCKISKYSREELIGQDHRIINSGYHPKEFIRDVWVTIANGKIWKGEFKNKAKDGTFYWVDTTIVPFINDQGKPYKYLAIRADITQSKEAELRILNLNEELENKVKERTLELTAALEREQINNEMKSRFVSMASHEFRTPLTSILSSASLLKKYITTEEQEKRVKHANRITSSVKNLNDILDDFLSLSKLEKGVIEAESSVFDLPEFLKEIVDEMEGMAIKKEQKIKYRHSGEIEAEQSKKVLKNILLNLLSNACKYSPEKKEIELTSSIGNNRVHISVRDHGIGIPEEEQDKLFSEFFRASNVENIEGTGLGLSIVKKYVELLNGTIRFTSVSNHGTTFEIEFPQYVK